MGKAKQESDLFIMKQGMQRGSKIGIMGGTFDPIHYGHLVTAEGARYRFGLEKVIFIPTGKPPHKQKPVTDPVHRLAMTRIAISSNDFFVASDLEVKSEKYSYTINTVAEIKSRYPASEIYFITGADAVLQILTWKNIERLFEMCCFVAATRPGYNLEGLRNYLNDLPPEFIEKIFSIVVPALAISSTDIRKRVREGAPIKYLLPEAVEDYINVYTLYK